MELEKPISGTPQFVKTFLRNPTTVGAIAPSSRHLALSMIADISLNHGEAVLELGPGTGSLTRQIIDILPDSKSYIGIEREPRFVELLEARFPDLRFVTGNAAYAASLYAQFTALPAKVIISGLPFATLVSQVRERIIHNIDQIMKPGCTFRTFQYVHAYPLPAAVQFRNRMGELFGPHERSRIVVRNLPPAFVLTWRR